MNSHLMLAIGDLQKHRDDIQRVIRDLERIMAGMPKEDAPSTHATAPLPVAKSDARTAPVRREKTPRGGHTKSAEKDAAGLVMIQAIGQAVTPLTPSEIMSATGLERWRVGQLLMEMTE